MVLLGNARLQAWRDTDKRIRQMTGKDPAHSEAIIIADVTTPYRLLTEVMRPRSARRSSPSSTCWCCMGANKPK